MRIGWKGDGCPPCIIGYICKDEAECLEGTIPYGIKYCYPFMIFCYGCCCWMKDICLWGSWLWSCLKGKEGILAACAEWKDPESSDDW